MKAPHGELQPFTLERGPWKGWFHPRVGPEISSAWLADPGAQIKHQAAPFRGASLDKHWFIKLRKGRKGRRALERSFRFGLELEEAGLPVPVHMAIIEGQGQTWLFTEYLEGEDLDIAIKGTAVEERAALLERLSLTIAALHMAGYRQRDLKAPNIHIDRESAGVMLLDLEGVRRTRSLRKHTKDLGRLAASLIAMDLDWTLFIEPYARVTEHQNPQQLARASFKMGQAKIARNAARKRVLR